MTFKIKIKKSIRLEEPQGWFFSGDNYFDHLRILSLTSIFDEIKNIYEHQRRDVASGWGRRLGARGLPAD